MTNPIKELYGSTVQPAITLTSLGIGAGRISAPVDNSVIRAPRGLLGLKITTGGTAPTANTVFKVYLIRNIGTLQGGTVGAAPGSADAAISTEPINAPCVMTLQVRNAANDLLADIKEVENPGPNFQFLVWNATNQIANASGYLLEWTPETPEVN